MREVNIAPKELKKCGCKLICYIVENCGQFRVPECPYAEYYYLEWIFVPEEFRSTGIGKVLLLECIRLAEYYDMEYIVLDAVNDDVIQWYSRYDFHKSECSIGDQVIMYKELINAS